MKRLLIRLIATAVSVAVFAVVGLSSAETASAATPAQAAASAASRIHGHVTGTTANGGTLVGSFTPAHFIKRPHRVVAVGKLTGTLTRHSGRTATISRTVYMPVNKAAFIGRQLPTAANRQAVAAAAAGTCQILNLVLGPLNLNLLGLVVHLNRVHLHITAQTGPGNLLGNLLCAIAGLLNGVPLSGLLGQLTNVLNKILTALNA
jgi:hypothetical protein